MKKGAGMIIIVYFCCFISKLNASRLFLLAGKYFIDPTSSTYHPFEPKKSFSALTTYFIYFVDHERLAVP